MTIEFAIKGLVVAALVMLFTGQSDDFRPQSLGHST